MTATDELRRLLDECGAERRERFYGRESVTTMFRAHGLEWHYRENRHGEIRLHVDGISPEQAIEATLGRGECHVVRKVERIPSEFDGRERDTVLFLCSECGMWVGKVAHYCPNCGRKVVDA